MKNNIVYKKANLAIKVKLDPLLENKGQQGEALRGSGIIWNSPP
jgi:hypothetical protein